MPLAFTGSAFRSAWIHYRLPPAPFGAQRFIHRAARPPPAHRSGHFQPFHSADLFPPHIHLLAILFANLGFFAFAGPFAPALPFIPPFQLRQVGFFSFALHRHRRYNRAGYRRRLCRSAALAFRLSSAGMAYSAGAIPGDAGIVKIFSFQAIAATPFAGCIYSPDTRCHFSPHLPFRISARARHLRSPAGSLGPFCRHRPSASGFRRAPDLIYLPAVYIPAASILFPTAIQACSLAAITAISPFLIRLPIPVFSQPFTHFGIDNTPILAFYRLLPI